MKKILCFTVLVIFLMQAVALAAFSVDINNVDKKTTIDQMANNLIQQGFNIVSTNDYSIVAQKNITNTWMCALYGSQYNTTPVIRLTINFAQINNNVQLNVDSNIITNPGSLYEQSQPYTGDDLKKMINNFKSYMEQNYSPHPLPPPTTLPSPPSNPAQ